MPTNTPITDYIGTRTADGGMSVAEITSDKQHDQYLELLDNLMARCADYQFRQDHISYSDELSRMRQTLRGFYLED